MKYIAKLPDGTVNVLDVAPKSIRVDGENYRVTHFEKVDVNRLSVSYFNVEKNEPITEELDADDPSITYHDPKQALKRFGKEAVQLQKVEDEEALKDRTFRDAWALNGNGLEVDMPKARNIHRDRMRAARKPKLEQLDVDYAKALEASVVTGLSPETDEYKTLEDIAARKKKLRDVTAMPEIDNAKTPEELKAVWPKELD